MVIATDTILAWHWTADALRDGRPIPPVGETLRHSGTLVLCDNGLHASERILDALRYAPGNVVHRVRCGGEMLRQDDKLVCHERTILWSHSVSDDLLRGFARAQARSVLHLWDAPQVVRDYLETGDETLRARAARAAAEAAAMWPTAEAAATWAAAARAAAARAALAEAEVDLIALILAESNRSEGGPAMSKALEAAARAHWDEVPPLERGEHVPLGETGTKYKFHSYVLWDDEDMRDSDRETARRKQRAAILAFLRVVNADDIGCDLVGDFDERAAIAKGKIAGEVIAAFTRLAEEPTP